ncbi:MAG: DUF3836 domain-containing protein, partial [Christensenellaceae bacterium]|nr:DUF3836 domain-containing protein [Christensenellaceae bacterium]
MSKRCAPIIIILSVAFCITLVLVSIFSTNTIAQAEPEEDFFIYNESDFLEFVSQSKSGDTFESRNVYLKNDIYLYNYIPTSTQQTTLLGAFNGTFCGSGHAIVGLKSNTLSSLFLSLGETSTIKD